ncbi:MAG TPA: ribosome recycling factor [Alphaproteobacteria bacterium]|nr:ribosome recycling factor [Alphaproteobacteria bacterium]HAJ46590.1 ribosome recycling factor [Alphaproteobacteria bacterium]
MAQAKGPTNLDLDDVKKRMAGAVTTLKHEFTGLRTGRASASLLEPVVVEAYGSQMPITQVGTINVPEPRMISVQVWDRAMVSAVDKAIRSAGLGLNPQADGTLIRIPIPQLTEERRKELTKIAHKYAESAKVAVRNVRRDAMDLLKRLEKDHHLGEDERKTQEEKVQDLTDQTIKDIDAALAAKDKEIMQI